MISGSPENREINGLGNSRIMEVAQKEKATQDADTACFPCPEVIADNRRSPLGQPLDGEEQHLGNGKQDGHRPYVVIVAVFLHPGVKG